MYSLRGINNMYEGGSRSDFVILGHPEYQLGRIRAGTHGYGEGWDTTPIPTYPKRSSVCDKLRRSGSESLLCRLRNPEPRPKPRARALAAAAAVAVSSPTSGSASVAAPRSAHLQFEDFIEALSSPSGPPRCEGTARITSGAGNHLGSAGTCRHYARINEELAELVARLKLDSEGTRRDLQASQSWMYYAGQLHHARKQANRRQVAATRTASTPSFVAHAS
mmetsp:Transcript_70623/g.199345  ORF Transcript_70623/g.199345 Transcript_70623/m.199345 type:complete len:221 (-) Transcript_70623:73-735(-)